LASPIQKSDFNPLSIENIDIGLHGIEFLQLPTFPTLIGSHSPFDEMNPIGTVSDDIKSLGCTPCHDGLNPTVLDVSKDITESFAPSFSDTNTSMIMNQLMPPMQDFVCSTAAPAYVPPNLDQVSNRTSYESLPDVRNIRNDFNVQYRQRSSNTDLGAEYLNMDPLQTSPNLPACFSFNRDHLHSNVIFEILYYEKKMNGFLEL
jgi:hypothetical protein